MGIVRPLALACSLLLVISACGGDDDGSADVADDTTDAAAGDGGSTSLFSSLDFEPVCRGIGIEAASAYSPGDGVNPIVGLAGEDPSYDSMYSMAFADGWEPEFEELDRTELVLCLNRVATVDGQLCEGFEDEDSGLAWSVMTFGATYEVSLRDARSAEPVAEETFEAAAGSCPMFSTYSEGDPTPVPDYATPDDDLQVWLVDHVTG